MKTFFLNFYLYNIKKKLCKDKEQNISNVKVTVI